MTSKIVTPQEYADRHKKAFREAFDFLNAHFPPVFSDDYFAKVVEDVTVVEAKDPNNPLLVHLLSGIFCYLDDESKLRREDGDSS